ncbi:MBL fold metallo-hydrolase [Amycolatopsis thermophila]|uniref:Glyoxylase-like metal-dependent hydrolase (Beta-lactamase superfamily II) n=1 Tax=Amycolatopsis thermophila TaxID=206084 RepID=A0ABU0EMY9_9PSEU|nr:MBL fold metallo-hydrolase [Amycolatopsis thermophila]MDQ0376650.1 glyoxylase-like metal-dependent hydrolase (beta-lactamase superfamily II) [Amycolatopsis thermophila]
MTWLELAEGVHARRYEHLDQTLGLVVGAERCLVIDTGGDEVQGAEFAAEVREITPLPWTVVITHAHFDHHFGNAAFLPCPIWAHERCRDALVRDGETDREAWVRRFHDEGQPVLAERLAAARLVLPDHLLTDRARLDLGGRTVELVHPGPAHTDHDVAVHVPDAGILFAGDLVEQGAPPSIGPDAHPRGWPPALDRLLALDPGTIVPGHGDPVGPEFVAAQRDELSRS